MITISLISFVLLVAEILKQYRKSSTLLLKFNEISIQLFQRIRALDTESAKMYLRYSLIWLSFDIFFTSNFITKHFGEDMSGYLLTGCVLFLVAFYFLVTQESFTTVNQKMNSALQRLFMPALYCSTGAFVLQSMSPSMIRDPLYGSVPEQFKIDFLKLCVAVSLTVTFVLVALMVACLLCKLVVSISYYGSNLVGKGIQQLAGIA